MMADQAERQLVSVLFTDIEGYSTLAQRDEKLALSYVTRYQQAVAGMTAAFNGELIHFYGDGSLTLHTSAVEAVRCAMAIQQKLRQDPAVPVRMGIHLGEIVRQKESIYGNTVNIASRLHNLGPSGAILISEQVAEQIRSHPDLVPEFIGTETVKNISQPVKVFAMAGEGLVVPTWETIHKRNKSRSKNSYLVPVIAFVAILIIGAIQILSNRDPLPDIVLDERVAVLPFVNNTGDTTLGYIGQVTSHHISRCLEEAEDARIVSYDHLMRNDELQRFGMFDMKSTMQRIGARNFIEGSYVFTKDSTLKFSSALRNGRNLEYIQHFPDVITPLRNVSDGIEELGQRVAGYWLSKEDRTLRIPLQDAYKAFAEAQYVWNSDFEKAEKYLKRSIAIDSTFLDAYYMLFDAYVNQWMYREAAAVLDSVNAFFDIEEFTAHQLLTHHYYEAQIASDNEKAYKVLREMYVKDPEEHFMNTQMAICALHFVNEPEECLEILEQIPFDSIDFDMNLHAQGRISLAIQASFATGQYQRAADYARFYPRNDSVGVHLELQARALAGVRDTAAIENLLNRIAIAGNDADYRIVLYALARDFRLLDEPVLARNFTQRALAAYEQYPSAIYGHLLYDSGETEKGLAHFESFREKYGEHPIVLLGLARGHALAGDTTKSASYMPLFAKSKPDQFDFGQTEYDQAKVYTFIGAHDEALIKLSQSITDGLFFSMRQVHNDPDLLPLAGHPDYDAVIHPLRD